MTKKQINGSAIPESLHPTDRIILENKMLKDRIKELEGASIKNNEPGFSGYEEENISMEPEKQNDAIEISNILEMLKNTDLDGHHLTERQQHSVKSFMLDYKQPLIAELERAQRMREALGFIAKGCLVPPDGGSPCFEDAIETAKQALPDAPKEGDDG